MAPVRPLSLESPSASRNLPEHRRLAVWLEAAAVRLRPWLPYVHVSMFFGFAGLIVVPALLPENPIARSVVGAANWVIWGLWFPLVFLSVLFTARTWCGMLCPMGAASEWANRMGPKRPVPAWLRWEGAPIVSFLLITILGQTVGVRDYPDAILLVFGATFAAAVVVGYFFGKGGRRRPWCRHACPIGLLLGIFSRLGIADLAPKRPQPGGEAYAQRGLCPTMIDLKRKTESRHCIMCMRCVYPGRNGGLELRLRPLGDEVANIRRHHASESEVWFLFMGTGIALGAFMWLVLPQYQWLRQTVGVWVIDQGWYWLGRSGPSWLMVVHPEAREVFVWLDFFLIVGWMLAVMIGVAITLTVLAGAASWLAGRLGADGSLRTRFVELGYQMAPPSMISLLLGLGGDLFNLIPEGPASVVKVVLLAGAVAWGIWLGWRILAGMSLGGWRAGIALVPGVTGNLLVAAAWWPAVVGI
ncbi:MAG: 4Fe-4S binding protein [Proteobacteria bacterium]|nr:4Fe-4S binding protein [Pseudomonadota bacterium]